MSDQFMPGPSREILSEKTPEGTSEEIALFAWREGWFDGRSGNQYRMLQEHAELQSLYSHGFERGERERSVIAEFEATRQESPEQIILKKAKRVEPVKPPAHILAVRRAINYCENNRHGFQGFCYLMVGMLAARALVSRGSRWS